MERKKNVTTESIYQKLLQKVAPLPSQAAYAHNLASIFSMHIHRNELIDDGISPDELPTPSAIVVAPTGQGKTYLVRKMAQCLTCTSLRLTAARCLQRGGEAQHLANAWLQRRRKSEMIRSLRAVFCFLMKSTSYAFGVTIMTKEMPW